MRFLLVRETESRAAGGRAAPREAASPAAATAEALPKGLVSALALPLALLRSAAGQRQAAAAAAGFHAVCFAAAKTGDWQFGEQERRFIAAHHCFLLAETSADWPSCAARAAACGFHGILLRCAPAAASSGSAIAPAAFARALRQIREAGLQAGLLGRWQAADIPRLLAFSPDYLGFSGHYKRAYAAARVLSAAGQSRRQAAGGQAAGGQAPRASAKQGAAMDKILVSDYIVPMHIGAYAHEKGAAQRVCFNICAELAPPRGKRAKPRMVEDVFSYDIILDAIARLAAEEHIELAETAAENLAAFLLTYRQIARVRVRVEKLDLAARAVGVEITRARGAAKSPAAKSRPRQKP